MSTNPSVSCRYISVTSLLVDVTHTRPLVHTYTRAYTRSLLHIHSQPRSLSSQKHEFTAAVSCSSCFLLFALASAPADATCLYVWGEQSRKEQKGDGLSACACVCGCSGTCRETCVSACLCTCENESAGAHACNVFICTWEHKQTHCNAQQHTATHCIELQHTATYCNTLRYTLTHCNTLRHTATHCTTGRIS